MEGGQNTATRAPLSTITPGGVGVMCLPLTTTPARFAIPAAFKGALCRVTAVGGYAQVLLGTSAVQVVANTASAVASEAVTVDATTGDHFADGISDKFTFHAEATHIAAVGSASCKLFIRLADPH